MNLPWVVPVFFAVVGACIGSFLNVCIYRIPAGLSVVHPRSRCQCGTPIAPYDNIPIIGWLLLRGRARCCGAPFSIRYPMVEALTALVFLFAWWRLPFFPAVWFCGVASVLIAASLIDYDTTTIPDRLTIGLVAAGLISALLWPHLHGEVTRYAAFAKGLFGLAVGTTLVAWIAFIGSAVLRRDAMGFGDVKLMAAVGAAFGWKAAVFGVFTGAVIGVAVALIAQRVRTHPLEREIPFGPSLSAASLAYPLFFVDWNDRILAQWSVVLSHLLNN